MKPSTEMGTLPYPPSDAELTDELVSLIDRLRRKGYGPITAEFDLALEGTANGFMEHLARHLLTEERILFPALREADPAGAGVFDELQQEHAHLRREAELLAEYVRSGKGTPALSKGRDFLATLFDHVHREAEAIRLAANKMSSEAALRLKDLLESEERDR
jgi:iron-sulfur cluster repair protein YtfE (RIC family)